ncbi:hypothetical protein [Wolbachia endosymbiont of Trichogramma pretiosum]|uniref:hypothetical protein n=1 Tax=Wolbachia endosymbiont of Trichogramma pretiosum TaxID=125593 RepID=UPI001FDED1C9|nr:hypothetical protein [Wolbachia endosymbiont of Trichogramma pretiosum]
MTDKKIRDSFISEAIKGNFKNVKNNHDSDIQEVLKTNYLVIYKKSLKAIYLILVPLHNYYILKKIKRKLINDTENGAKN